MKKFYPDVVLIVRDRKWFAENKADMKRDVHGWDSLGDNLKKMPPAKKLF